MKSLTRRLDARRSTRRLALLLPADISDTEEVRVQTRKLQRTVKDLLKKHFGAAFRTSGMTSCALNLLLEPSALWLVTSPREGLDLAQEVRSAFNSTGLSEILQNADMHRLRRELPNLIDRARDRFPFDPLVTTFEGKRPGYDDEWTITAKRTPAEAASMHHEVRSIALFSLFEPSHPFSRLAAYALTSKTISSDLDLSGFCNTVYKLRVVLRSFQEFPREFASY